MNSEKSLASIFPGGKMPTFVSDLPLALDIFGSRGFNTASLSTLEIGEIDLAGGVVFAPCHSEAMPSREVLNRIFSFSAVLVMPFVSFCSRDKSLEYAATKLLEIDFVEACKNNLKTITALEKQRGAIKVKSNQYVLDVRLGESVNIALPKLEPHIEVGEWVSVSQFLEVGLVPNEDYSSYLASGIIHCDGAAVANHRKNYRSSRPLAEKAWIIIEDLHRKGDFPLNITIKDSIVLRIETASGRCILRQMISLTDETFRGKLIELSFASMPAFDEIDWSVNSQLNEAAGGVHIALGTGVDAAHIDFISTNASFE